MLKYIVGIESSCDETAVGIFDAAEQKLLCNVVFSQIDLHRQFGGVMPEVASRSHVEKIGLIFQKALDQVKISIDQISAIGVTTTPGLAGSLLAGVCFAKGIGIALDIPVVPINHHLGHICSGWIDEDHKILEDLQFPHLSLSMSGGHSNICLVSSPTEFKVVGKTNDDAAGEAFDKVAKLLEASYPGGPAIEKLAQYVSNHDYFNYPRNKFNRPRAGEENTPGLEDPNLSFSFSGLKTAVLYDMVKKGYFSEDLKRTYKDLDQTTKGKIASSFQWAVADTILQKIDYCLDIYPGVGQVFFVGGVSCNNFIREKLSKYGKEKHVDVRFPLRRLCTDNGAMIAVATYFTLISPDYKPTPLSEIDVFQQ